MKYANNKKKNSEIAEVCEKIKQNYICEVESVERFARDL